MKNINPVDTSIALIFFDVFNKTFFYVLEGFWVSPAIVEKVYWIGQSATFAFYIFTIKVVSDSLDTLAKRKVSLIMRNWLWFAFADIIDECVGNIIPNPLEYAVFGLVMLAVWFKLKKLNNEST